jgi:glycine/D-amino acid oxidase-like deaminating enzyme
VKPPDATKALEGIETSDGSKLSAADYVFACGPWLPKLFPRLLGPRIFPTRQEVFFFATPPGDGRFSGGALPGWADFNDGDIYYGFPDLESRGFKIAHDAHGPAMDPDTGDRLPSAGALADVRAFMARRFPALAEAPLKSSRTCRYELSPDSHFIAAPHPEHPSVWIVGGGSGHGFKHGPAMAERLVGAWDGGAPLPARFAIGDRAPGRSLRTAGSGVPS